MVVVSLAKSWQLPILEQVDALEKFVRQATGKKNIRLNTKYPLACGLFACAIEILTTKGKKLPYLLKLSIDPNELVTLSTLMELDLEGTPKVYAIGLGPKPEDSNVTPHADHIVLSVVERVVSFDEAEKLKYEKDVWWKPVTRLEAQIHELENDPNLQMISLETSLAMAEILEWSGDKAAAEAIRKLHEHGINWLDNHKRNYGWRAFRGKPKTLVIVDPAGETELEPPDNIEWVVG